MALIPSNNGKQLRSGRLVGAAEDKIGDEETKPEIHLPLEILENICRYLDASSLRQCRLVSQNWNAEATRTLTHEQRLESTKWQGSNGAKRLQILDILNKTEVPQLFSDSSVTSGHRLYQSLPLFKEHGEIISSLYLNFKPAMTPIEGNQAMGNIWLVIQNCKNLKTLTLCVPVMSNSSLEECATRYYQRQQCINNNNVPHMFESLEEIRFLGCFLLQFPDFAAQLLKYNKEEKVLIVNVESYFPGNTLPTTYFRYLSLIMNMLRYEFEGKVGEKKGALLTTRIRY